MIATLCTAGQWSDVRANVVRKMVGSDLLARFQVDATRSILKALGDPQPARIVTAGTGSGKTLAFYLPALLDIARTTREAHRPAHAGALSAQRTAA